MVSAASLLQYVLPAQHAGIPIEDMCNIIGVEPSALYDLEAYYPAPVVYELAREVVNRLGDEYFWLKAPSPELVPTNNLFFYILFQAQTLFDFMLRAERLYNYFTDEVSPSHRLIDDHYFYLANFHRPESEVSPYRVDWWFSITRLSATLFAGEQYKMTEIYLSSPFNSRREVYEEYFQVPVRIDQPQIAVYVPRSNLDLPNIRNLCDPQLEKLLMRQLKGRAHGKSQSNDFLEKLRDILRQQLPNGTPNLDAIASQFLMSPRTLQRKLSEDGTNFSEQVRILRSQLATQYLGQSEFSISQIAFLLGFQDSRSLTVAFRSWFDMTPSEYRQRNAT